LIDADRRLSALAARYDARYTRYADDLTFSGDGKLPGLAEIADILRSVNLVLHPTKSKQRKRGQALYVTGYSVTDKSPHAPRPMKRRLRQELYYIRKYGLAEHLARLGRDSIWSEHDRIAGQIEHVRHVDPKVGDDLFDWWIKRPKDSEQRVVRSSTRVPTQVLMLFDDSGFRFCSEDYRALCTVILREQESTRERVLEMGDKDEQWGSRRQAAESVVRAPGVLPVGICLSART
jgi:hypothetical protein